MKQKKLTWAEIVDNDELLAKMWNKFVAVDEEVAKEAEDYGEKYMKLYPNTYEGVLDAYSGYVDKFLEGNMSFWGESGSEGYLFCDKWFRINIASSEEQYLTSDECAMELIELILLDRFGDMTKESVGIKRRFKQYCVEHQNEFKEQETA